MVMNMKICNICPRNCGIDRNVKKGVCNSTNTIKLARASLHMWEEPCVSGNVGSGTVFFSGCNLRCVYCQNLAISSAKTGKEVSEERFYDVLFELKNMGAANINLVTADHYIPLITEPLFSARKNGLDIPVILNTSSYIKTDTLKLVEGAIDVYLPDFKYYTSDIAKKYSSATDYPEVAKDAIEYMYSVSGKPEFNKDGYITSGVIVRHLVLPSNILNTKRVLNYLNSTYGNDIYISLMSQYTPCNNLLEYPEINRKLSQTEYEKVVNYAIELGFSNVYIQELDSACESYIPPFDLSGI